MKLPYSILAILLIAIAVVFVFKIAEDWGRRRNGFSSDKMTSSGKTKEGSQKEKLIDFWCIEALTLAVGVISAILL